MPEKPYRQEAPYAMQVELAEGCNLRCSFCGLNGIRGKDNNFKFMDPNTMVKLCHQVNRANWNVRIELAMHGEPTMHPQFIEMVKGIRHRCPTNHLMVTSNGGGLLKDTTATINEAMKYVNVLALDAYENVNIVPKIMKQYKGPIPLRIYPEDNKANPHKRRKLSEHDIVIIQDISEATKGTHSLLNNHAGSGAPPNQNQQGKRCAKPFREISVRWDGSIAVCCNDWRGVYQCGNINEEDIDKIWNNPAFRAARRKLYHGERDFGPCEGCDAVSYRVGLLPDKYGKESLPQVTKLDKAVIKEACAGTPYTLPVLRTWEK